MLQCHQELLAGGFRDQFDEVPRSEVDPKIVSKKVSQSVRRTISDVEIQVQCLSDHLEFHRGALVNTVVGLQDFELEPDIVCALLRGLSRGRWTIDETVIGSHWECFWGFELARGSSHDLFKTGHLALLLF